MSDTVQQMNDAGTRSSHDYNVATWQFHLPNEMRRLGPNYEILARQHKSGAALGIQDARKAAPDTPCICIGSGPSLDKALPLLKDWKGGIICSTSQGMTLRKWGIEPDYLVALDSNTPPEELGPWSLWKGTKTGLIAQPGVETRTVEYWKGKSYWFRKYEPVADAPRIFYEMVQPLVFNEGPDKSWLQVQFVMLASVAPALCFVAKYLGYSPIFLSGIEFGWRDDAHSRFQSWTLEGKRWTANPVPISGMMDAGRPEVTPYKAENGAWTVGIQEFYKRNFLLGLRLDQWSVWDCGGEGALSEVPRLDIAEVIAKQGKDFVFPPLAEVDAKYDEYLAKHKTYVVKWNGGMNFVESPDWQKDFPKAFGDAKRQGSTDCDLLANMRRFAKAHGYGVTDDMEKEWMDTMERVAKAVPIQVAVKTMDSRLMKCVGIIDTLKVHPSLGVMPDFRRCVREMDAVLKGQCDDGK